MIGAPEALLFSAKTGPQNGMVRQGTHAVSRRQFKQHRHATGIVIGARVHSRVSVGNTPPQAVFVSPAQMVVVTSNDAPTPSGVLNRRRRAQHISPHNFGHHRHAHGLERVSMNLHWRVRLVFEGLTVTQVSSLQESQCLHAALHPIPSCISTGLASLSALKTIVCQGHHIGPHGLCARRSALIRDHKTG